MTIKIYRSKALSGFWTAFGVSRFDFGALNLDGGFQIMDARSMSQSTETQPAGLLETVLSRHCTLSAQRQDLVDDILVRLANAESQCVQQLSSTLSTETTISDLGLQEENSRLGSGQSQNVKPQFPTVENNVIFLFYFLI